MGVNELSMSPSMIPEIKESIRKIKGTTEVLIILEGILKINFLVT